MKKILFYSMAIAAMTMVSCSNDEGQGTTENQAKAAFSATIAGQPQTRAYDTAWESGDAIGITGTTGQTAYNNVQYVTANGDGNFTVATAGADIYYQDTQDVTFTAYYPWNSLTASSSVSADTWMQANQKTFDFLWAQATGSKANRNVAFTFAHKMAKVVITLKKGADVSFDEVKAAKLSLNGFLHEGTFDVAAGVATPAGTAAAWQFAGNTSEDACNAPYATNQTAETVAYTLIMFPQEFTAALPLTAELTGMQSFGTNLDFTTANTNAGDAAAKNEWVAGRQYNISVTLHKTSITVDGCTISQWENADGGNFDAN